MKWVKLKRYCELSGDTDDAVHSKLSKGIWLRDLHVKKAEDGALWVNLEIIELWVEIGTAGVLTQQEELKAGCPPCSSSRSS